MTKIALKTLDSERLPDWEAGQAMIDAYQNQNLLTIPGPDNTKLKGLRVDRKDIEDILEDSTIEEIFIIFGLKEINSEITFTTVLTGIRNNRIVKDMAIDFCDPCPSDCPENF